MNIRGLFIVVSVLVVLSSCRRDNIEHYIYKETDLSGEWTVSGKDTSLSFTGIVPGCVHTDMYLAGLIADPFKDTVENSLQWIGQKSWIYTRIFNLSKSDLEIRNIDICAEGLDTHAKVSINGTEIFRTNNMFRSWQVPVKEVLKAGVNTIEIEFMPSQDFEKQEQSKLNYTLPDDRVFSRKAPYHSGWDWGPTYRTMGIWKDISLIAWEGISTKSAFIVTKEISDSLSRLELNLQLDCDKAGQVVLTAIDNLTREVLIDTVVHVTLGENHLRSKFEIKRPALWWCNGMGAQSLYAMDIVAEMDGRSAPVTTVGYGIRTIELVTENDSIGQSFYFKLNGKPVFAKGANYIPMDSFNPRVSTAKKRELLEMAAIANMNMIRVWGGGIYESDDFYHICDSLGLLVWQDFMFACALYPGDEYFLNNVQVEAEQNMARIAKHPSIALWCGNNEVKNGWEDWGWQAQFGYSQDVQKEISTNYFKLFDSLLPLVVNDLKTEIPYWPSSPLYGWGHNESNTHGDSHYWGVWWGKEPFEVYNTKVGRFMSEYGFQGFPDIKTVNWFRGSSPTLGDASLKAHQKHPVGYETIEEYMARSYPVPTEISDYIYLSQLLQAEGMATAIRAHRRSMPHCMGTLYWQLNDCWPVVSWSSVDYFLRPKALYYYVSREFAEITAEFRKETNSVFVVSDSPDNKEVKLTMKLCKLTGEKVWEMNREITLAPVSSKEVLIDDVVFRNVSDPENLFLAVSIVSEGEVVYNSSFTLVPDNKLLLSKANIEVDYLKESNGAVITLEAKIFIRGLMLSFDNADPLFSDNYFNLIPGVKKTVFVSGNTPDADGLKMRCLNDIVIENRN